jgi:hypothetical protein
MDMTLNRRGKVHQTGTFVVFSWTPEGRALISAPAAAAERPLTRLRRLGGRFDAPLYYLLLLAIAGFALGYAVQVLPR